MNNASRETFARGMVAVRTLYGKQWDVELGFAAEWADDVDVDEIDDLEPGGDAAMCFRKGSDRYWFLINDGSWDADDPRGEMIEALLAERARGTSVCAQNDALAERVTALCNGVDGHASRDSDGGDRVALGFARQLSAVARTLLAERAKDGEALAVAKAALDVTEAKMREVMAERDTAKQATRDAWAAQHHALDLASDRGVKLEILAAERDAAIREADRLRHGVPIEGDFVCPDALALTEAMRVIEAGRALGENANVATMEALHAAVAAFGAWERGERKAGGK